MLCDNQFCLATMTLYFLAVWTQSGESGNTLNNQVQWYVRRESKHLRSAYSDRSRVQQPMFGERQNALLLLSKPPQRRQSGAAAHDFGSLHRKRKAPEVSPRQCVRDRSLSVETTGSINDSTAAELQSPKQD